MRSTICTGGTRVVEPVEEQHGVVLDRRGLLVCVRDFISEMLVRWSAW